MTAPTPQRLTGKPTILGDGMTIVRTLPSARRRSIGAWCFLDHFGPVDVGGQDGLRVGPHPHIGLQTVTWLLSGEILHRDSLGSVQVIRPGQLNLMTSGCGISHSEESPPEHSPSLHGAQLWIALPDAHRLTEPTFAHHAELPIFTHDGLHISVLLGDLLGHVSPGKIFTPLMGAELFADAATQVTLPLRADFEFGIQVLTGRLRVDDEVLEPGTLLYLEAGRDALNLIADSGCRALLIGGEPLQEPLLMWWNFVARTQAELSMACHDWNAGAKYFGEVTGYPGKRLEAPLPPW
mgnify:FL=1